MGFLDRFMDAAKKQASKEAAKKQIARQESLPPMPDDLRTHLNRECVRVWLNDEGLAFTEGKCMESVPVRVRKARKVEVGAEYNVLLTDGTVIGTLDLDGFLRSGVKTRGEVTAEVSGPIWRESQYGTVHIPITDEAKKRQEMKVWIDVSASHWSGPDGLRVEATGGEILESRNGNGKPTYVVIGAGTRLFDVTPRMGCYSKVAERANLPIRRVIAESKENKYGEYWHVGLYF